MTKEQKLFSRKIGLVFIVGPDGEKYLRLASNLGHPIATLELARSVGLVYALNRLSYNARRGRGKIITNDIRKVYEKHGGLFDLGLAQGVGNFHALNKHLQKAIGIDIGKGVLGTSDKLGSYALERALNRRMRASARLADFLISYGTMRIPPSFTYKCDDDWCHVIGGLLSYRFSVQNEPKCGPTVNFTTNCHFKFLLVGKVNINTGSHPGRNIVSNIQRAQNCCKAKGTFKRVGEEWHLIGPIRAE